MGTALTYISVVIRVLFQADTKTADRKWDEDQLTTAGWLMCWRQMRNFGRGRPHAYAKP